MNVVIFSLLPDRFNLSDFYRSENHQIEGVQVSFGSGIWIVKKLLAQACLAGKTSQIV